MTAGSLVRTAVGVAGRVAGPVLLRATTRRDQAIVLLYHRVSPQPDPAYPPLHPATFDEHLAVVTSHFSVVRLDDLLDDLAAGRSLAGRCAITFDDGFRDFAEHAYPALLRRRVPVTHFVVSGCVETGRPTWNYRLNRLQATVTTKRRLGALPPDEREAWLGEQEATAGIVDDGHLVLRPDELATFDPEIVDWQSHGATHSMAGSQPEPELAEELERSRAAISAWTGRPVSVFSYPNGDASPVAEQVVTSCGYRAAVVVGERAVAPRTPLTSVPRFDVGRYPVSWLPLVVSGALETTRRLR